MVTETVVDHGLTGPELLNAAAAEVTSWPSVSASRARQVKWVVGEYTRALAHAEHPLADDADVRRVFTAGPVGAYLRLACTGELRKRTAADPAKGSDHSEQIRLEVLRLLVQGQTNQQIARNLLISVSTVKRHIRHISAKLGVCDRVQVAVRAVELGLLGERNGD